ncbi:hypothetical protein BJX64DRAFT_248765 [Aspergillus heterothallicus]
MAEKTPSMIWPARRSLNLQSHVVSLKGFTLILGIGCFAKPVPNSLDYYCPKTFDCWRLNSNLARYLSLQKIMQLLYDTSGTIYKSISC